MKVHALRFKKRSKNVFLQTFIEITTDLWRKTFFMKALGNKTFCTYIFGLLFHTDEHSGYIWTIQTQKFLVKFRLTWILKLAPLSHHSIHLPHLNILLLLLSLLSLSPAATQTSQSPPIPPIQHPQGQLHCANNHSKHCAQKRRNLIEVFKNKWPKGFLFLLLTHTHLCTHRQNENNSKPHIHCEFLIERNWNVRLLSLIWNEQVRNC